MRGTDPKADPPKQDIARFTAQTCHLSHESQSMQVMVVVSTLFGVSVAFVILRVASKLISRTFCTEDYFIIAATILAVVPLTTVLCSESCRFFSPRCLRIIIFE